MSEQRPRASLGWRLWQQLPLLVALVVLWMLLWGIVDWLTLATGVILALVVTRLFYLPPVELSGRFNPLWFLAFLARFALNLFVASFLVAYQALRPKGIKSNAVIAVDLVTRSDFVMTATAIAISLVPGSLVVEVDRQRSILYLHVLSVADRDETDLVRMRVLSVERQLVRAFGSRDDVERTSR
jgi:multicomponent Na+:H+ antiporter subunit E